MSGTRIYEPRLAEAWNDFNARARNGHFLFDRRFMDYHADRFEDASLAVFEGDRIVGLIPASRHGDEVVSHGGLTFGGLVVDRAGTAQVMTMLDACAEAWARVGAKTLTYKAMPSIYAAAPAEADRYWLFRNGARLVRRDLSAAIDYRARGAVSTRRSRGIKKAASGGLSFGRSSNWPGYWELLAKVLEDRHGVSPVHSLAEIEMLAGRFPDEIALYTAERAGRILAGVVAFRSRFVAHAQYIAADEEGRQAAALDGLFEHMIGVHAEGCRHFDFGISNTDRGRVLNEGLMRQKEEFGASAVACDFYELGIGR
ncbi:MAG TPA: GNAT family N-acetyltransferase [Caulobacteraceae bacterium]|nr:GNAT family N-acetyltransferase [Caulobacteraceae bacterium]